jgi:hypothetical protein
MVRVHPDPPMNVDRRRHSAPLSTLPTNVGGSALGLDWLDAHPSLSDLWLLGILSI